MGLTRITSRHEITQAVDQLLQTFRGAGTQTSRTLGYRGGQREIEQLYVVDSADVWMGYRKLDNRHWCAFGQPPLAEKGPVSITVEINPPVEGLNRRLGGLFARSESGAIHLCHTGRIGGGKPGVGKDDFLQWRGQSIQRIGDPDGAQTLALPIAELGSDRVINQIADYTRHVADFKAGKPEPVPQVPPPAFAGREEEFEGDTAIPPHDGHTASCDHGIVRNRLAALLRATGHQVARDQARDLILGDPQAPEAEFEIKTSSTPQSIYTAVGQLLIHHTATPAHRRVAVLPQPVQPQFHQALASLRIDLVTYAWSETHLHFTGLDAIAADVALQAPISQ